MTVSVCLKVQDGVVLASDSAATLMGDGGVGNVYDNANKIANLPKGWPIGAMTWGLGGFGNTSVSTALKDLRTRFQGGTVWVNESSADDISEEPEGTDEQSVASRLRRLSFSIPQPEEAYPEWVLDPDSYAMTDVALSAMEFIRQEHYEPTYRDLESKPTFGMFVVGYSATGGLAEVYEIGVDEDGTWTGPDLMFPEDQFGLTWRGQPEWISRLLMGFSPSISQAFIDDFGLPEDQVGPALETIRRYSEVSLYHPAMPIQDAIDLAAFLVDFTKAVVRFIPGAPTVGGLTEVAAITKHEGFKWVTRKHYFDRTLNPLSEEL